MCDTVYNRMSKEDDSKAIINGWERSGIFEAVTDGSSALLSIDSFQDITPLASTYDRGNKIVYLIEINEDFFNLRLATDDKFDWGNEENDQFDVNAFEFIVDDE